MKTFYIGEHVAIELDRHFFAIGIVIGWGSICIDLGHIIIRFY